MGYTWNREEVGATSGVLAEKVKVDYPTKTPIVGRLMSYTEIDFPRKPVEMPEKIQYFLEEADRRVDSFYEEGLARRYPRFIPSDPSVVYSAIASLKGSGQLQGNVFCEWGCGHGIAAGFAALLGMEAYGIEIETELVDRAILLMRDTNVPVEILETSYLPEGFEESDGHGGKDLVTPGELIPNGGDLSPPEYEGLDPDAVDLFFVYPWPGQEEMMLDLFTAVASDGAILLMYGGDGDISAYLRGAD